MHKFIADIHPGAKLFVFQEVYETLLYLLAPFVLPISFIVRPAFAGYLFTGGFALYAANVVIFNEIHLRLKRERVPSKCVYLYYMPYKIVLTLINVGSCYWSLYKYATYFAKRHPKIIEDEKAVNVVMRMQESSDPTQKEGRRMTVTAIGAQLNGSIIDSSGNETGERRMTITALGPLLDPDLSPIVEQSDTPGPVITVGGRKFSIASMSAPSQHSRREGEAQGLGIDIVDARPSHTRNGSSNRERNLSRHSSTGDAGRTSSRNSSRRSRRSGSLRRSGSIGRQRSGDSLENTDFVSPGYEDLLDRLAIIEQRLNRQNVETMNVEIEPVALPPPTYQSPYQHSVRNHQESERDPDSESEVDYLEKELSRKTDDSKSMA